METVHFYLWYLFVHDPLSGAVMVLGAAAVAGGVMLLGRKL